MTDKLELNKLNEDNNEETSETNEDGYKEFIALKFPLGELSLGSNTTSMAELVKHVHNLHSELYLRNYAGMKKPKLYLG